MSMWKQKRTAHSGRRARNSVFLILLALRRITVEAVFSHDESYLPKLYEKKCQEWGFSPSQLACETCEVLLMQETDTVVNSDESSFKRFYEECKFCCQSWRVNKDPSRVGKIHPAAFKSASLQLGEVKNGGDMQGIPPEIAAQFGMAMNFGAGRKTEAHEFIQSGDFERLKDLKGDDVIFIETKSDTKGASLILAPKTGDLKVVVDVSDWKQDDIRDLLNFALPDEKYF